MKDWLLSIDIGRHVTGLDVAADDEAVAVGLQSPIGGVTAKSRKPWERREITPWVGRLVCLDERQPLERIREGFFHLS